MTYDLKINEFVTLQSKVPYFLTFIYFLMERQSGRKREIPSAGSLPENGCNKWV